MPNFKYQPVKSNYSKLAKPNTLNPDLGNGDRMVANSQAMAQPNMPSGNVGAQNAALTGAVGRYQEKKDEKNSTLVDKEGNIKLGTPKVYDSVGEAGSGFVNLSHLLGLNRASGEQSANDLARRVKESGTSAAAGIQKKEDEFTTAAKAGMGWKNHELFDPASGGADQQIKEAREAKYTGPNDMASMSGYADLSKKVSDAQEAAKNTQSGYGMAAQVGKETGLSPTQSAASAFYMGVNNPNVKKAGGMFVNLQKALDDANSRSMASSQWAKGEATRYQANADPWQKERDDWNNAPKALTDQERVAAKEQEGLDRTKIMADNHRNAGELDVKATDDVLFAIKQGMPSELAYMGVSYEQWVEAGRPTYEEWLAKGG